MRAWALNDRGGWGREFLLEAATRGIRGAAFNAGHFTQHIEQGGIEPGDVCFMRLDQHQPRLATEKPLLATLEAKGAILIPNRFHGELYEDKYLQARAFSPFMPETVLIDDEAKAMHMIGVFDYPFISKSKTGSASADVRLIRNANEAKREIEAVFGDGLNTVHRACETVQKDYLIWQEFLSGNPYDYRIVATGRSLMALQRHNWPGTVFASGSGENNPAPETPELWDVLRAAHKFFAATQARWCGIDMVRDSRSGQWKLLETTLGWQQSAYLDCPYYCDAGDGYGWFRHKKGARGAQMFAVLWDEIEAGVFA